MQSLLPIKKCIELSGFRVFDIVSGQFLFVAFALG